MSAKLDERIAAAERLLDEAVRVEVACFVGQAIEDRLRARPNFAASIAPEVLAHVRDTVEAALVEEPAKLHQPLRDLRAFLGATARGEAEETRAFVKVVGGVVETARGMLKSWLFPDDRKPDRAEDIGADFDAEHQLAFTPSGNLLYAWRKLRALDMLRNRIHDAPDRPLSPTYDVRCFLPEALPPEGN